MPWYIMHHRLYLVETYLFKRVVAIQHHKQRYVVSETYYHPNRRLNAAVTDLMSPVDREIIVTQ